MTNGLFCSVCDHSPHSPASRGSWYNDNSLAVFTPGLDDQVDYYVSKRLFDSALSQNQTVKKPDKGGHTIMSHYDTDASIDNDYIIHAWDRCTEQYRLDAHGAPELQRLDAGNLGQLLEEQHLFVEVGAAEMARLIKQMLRFSEDALLPSPDCTLLLLNANGVALHAVGTEIEGGRDARYSGMDAGFIWREEYVGVTGPSLCLHDMKPRMVHRQEHLFRNFVEMACCAMPIWAPSGALLGVIDSTYSHSGYAKSAYVSVMPLLAQLARRIEMKYFARNYQDHVILSVSQLNDYTDYDDEALFAINENGFIIAAEFALTKCIISDAGGRLVGANVRDVFDVSLDKILDDHHRTEKSQSKALPRNAGGRDDLRVFSLPDNVPFRVVMNGILRNTSHSRDETSVQVHDSLLALSGDDAVVSDNICRIHKVLNKNISILLLGETGTGKDTFARAIHRASDRRGKPFVAINCAAIPESLIESELFGYEPGSFTGASRAGKQGKVMAANGGTLFLDEIGDMPAALQGRLLRVLEEREVTPLGATKVNPVDIRVISATNKSIDALVQQGSFRIDLLYRINDVVLSLPSLRERSDKIRLIETIYQQECGASEIRMSADVWHIFLDYSWPGNIRELRSVIRTALALSDGNAIGCEDLPVRLVEARDGPHGRAATSAATPPLNDRDVLERNRILSELEHHHWRVIDTAKFLKVSRNTLYRKMRLYGIMADNV